MLHTPSSPSPPSPPFPLWVLDISILNSQEVLVSFQDNRPFSRKGCSLIACCLLLYADFFFFFFFLLLEYRYGTLLSRTERQMEFQRRNHNIWSNSVSDRQEKTNRLFSREMTFAKRTRCEITRKCYVKA